MKKVLGFMLILICLTSKIYSQNNLKLSLDSILKCDQKYRSLIQLTSDSTKNDSIAKVFSIDFSETALYLLKLQAPIDSSNSYFIIKILDSIGYPGKSLVGEDANLVAFYVIQHSNKELLTKYLPLIKDAGKKKEIPFKLYCMMEDRLNMSNMKPQKYGTQATCRKLKNGVTECFIWPVKNTFLVNTRRKRAGFEQNIQENAKRLGVHYRKVKMSEIF